MKAKVYECNHCGSMDIKLQHDGYMHSFICNQCGTTGSGSNFDMLKKALTEVEMPEPLGRPAISHLESAKNFWDQFIRPYVDEFYAPQPFLPSKFKMMLQPGKKSYILAEGMVETTTKDGMRYVNPCPPQSKRLEDQEATDIWKRMVEEYDLPKAASKVIVENDADSKQVEVKVAVTLQKSLGKAAGRPLTQAEKDMAQGQVINTTQPGNQKWYIASKVGCRPGLEDYLGRGGATVTSVKRAMRFRTESACRSYILAHGGLTRWKVESIME